MPFGQLTSLAGRNFGGGSVSGAPQTCGQLEPGLTRQAFDNPVATDFTNWATAVQQKGFLLHSFVKKIVVRKHGDVNFLPGLMPFREALQHDYVRKRLSRIREVTDHL